MTPQLSPQVFKLDGEGRWNKGLFPTNRESIFYRSVTMT